MKNLIARILGAAPKTATTDIRRQRTHIPELLDRPLSLEEATESDPKDVRLRCRLGVAWLEVDDVEEAQRSFEQALALVPDWPDALNGLGNTLREQGRLSEAVQLYRRAIEVQRSHREAFQNLLFAMLCQEGASEDQIFAWHRRFAEQFEKPSRPDAQYSNVRDPDRRLKIGYVSPDFRKHVVGYCILPVIERHDRGKFEVHCYFNGLAPDALTRDIKDRADQWRDIARLSDEKFVAAMRGDGIDILVDLSGHTPGNRLTALAEKPAPVQVTYLDYSATTGMRSIDYRLTDAVCDPQGVADPYYSEKLVRLPGTYLLYNPPALPATPRRERDGRLILSCVNSFNRVNPEAMACWAEILRRVEEAELFLVGVPQGACEKRIKDWFAAKGIAAHRIHPFGYLSYEDFVALIERTDVALAPFPYNGAMSTLDCLWHGVPVVCREGGETFHSRMGQSILSVIGLDELVAPNLDAYAGKVIELCLDRERRHVLRDSLRNKIAQSPLQDFDGFTRSLEQEYRRMWTSYCRS